MINNIDENIYNFGDTVFGTFVPIQLTTISKDHPVYCIINVLTIQDDLGNLLLADISTKTLNTVSPKLFP